MVALVYMARSSDRSERIEARRFYLEKFKITYGQAAAVAFEDNLQAAAQRDGEDLLVRRRRSGLQQSELD